MSINILTDKKFDKEVLQYKGVVVIYFWATWCGSCKAQEPIMEELEKEVTDVKVYKMDVSDNPTTSSNYFVMSLPTIIIFKNGEVGDTMTGSQQLATLKKKLENYI